MCFVKLTKVVVLICRCFFSVCSAFLFWLCCEHSQRVCCQIDESCCLNLQVFFFLFAVRFFFGCVVSMCSVRLVKLRKLFPVDTPLVLRLDKDAYGKKPFFS